MYKNKAQKPQLCSQTFLSTSFKLVNAVNHQFKPQTCQLVATIYCQALVIIEHHSVAGDNACCWQLLPKRCLVCSIFGIWFLFFITKVSQELKLPQWLGSRILSNSGLPRVKQICMDLRNSKFWHSKNSLATTVSVENRFAKIRQTCYSVAIEVERTVSQVCFQRYSRQVPRNCHSLTHFAFTKMWHVGPQAPL